MDQKQKLAELTINELQFYGRSKKETIESAWRIGKYLT